MRYKNLATNQSSSVFQRADIMRNVITPLCLLFLSVAAMPFQAYPAGPTYPISTDVQTTRQRTVRPVSIPDAIHLTIDEVEQYAPNGYSWWRLGDPVDAGALLPDNTTPEPSHPTETLLTFFTMSDIHIDDKESPAELVYTGTVSLFGNTNSSGYSPVILSTTQVLDAAVQTINVLNGRTPFDFGISLGDDANSTQYNELRWFIDVMDGKKITPSSGAHRGASSIDYQKPYQSAGLDKSIPWYQAIGNHDQYWGGCRAFNDYVRKVLVGNTVLDIGLSDAPEFNPSLDSRGYYVGTIDGMTPYGTIIDGGADGTMAQPVVAPDPKRRSLTTDTSQTLNWMKEFFNTTSEPKGHGFTQANLDNDFACYTFEPKASVPLKVIVLDDVCKMNQMQGGGGCLDQARYDWLINELDQGQAEGKLMIIAAHIPVGPQLNIPDAPLMPNLCPKLPHPLNTTVIPLFTSTCHGSSNLGTPCCEGVPIENNEPFPPYSVVTDTTLLQTLHNYSNLLLWISGHRHINTVTPQPAPAGANPEFGFWEVETSSLRDFPQQFRTFQIVRNAENTVSIFVTNVDPAVQGESPAAKSREYAIGAYRIVMGVPGLTDTHSHAYNAELVKPLPAPYTLTVDVTGSGSGSVMSTPYSGVNCTAGICTATYLPGTQLTLVATPAAGSAIAGWTPSAGMSTFSISMNGDVDVAAIFTRDPTLVVTPDYKSFGTIKIGKKGVATFTVRNTGTKGVADLIIESITKTETANPAQFTLVAGKDRCSGKTIKPGKSCTFQVSFMPTSAYTKSATVTIPSNDPNTPNSIQLTGVGK